MQTASALQAHTESATERDPLELLSRSQIAREYKIALPTQIAWFNVNRYGWRDICYKVGARVFVRRESIERWLEGRRGLVA